MLTQNNIMEGQGYKFSLKTTNPMHYSSPISANRAPKDGDIISQFGTMFKMAIDSVNDKQIKSDNLIVEAGTNPDQVDISDVMNSIAEAELSLSMTKAVVDRAIRAYQEISTMR